MIVEVLAVVASLVWFANYCLRYKHAKELEKIIELQQKKLEIKSKVIKSLYESKATIHKQLR